MHLLSWPEHCRTYLTRVAACRMRYPQWKTDTPDDEMAAEESFNDSLRDVQDMSLRLSIDGDKSSLTESLDVNATSGDHEVQDQVKRVLRKMKKSDSGLKDDEDVNKLPDNAWNKYPLLRRRRKLIVIALDCYDESGAPEKKMIQAIQEIFKATRLDSQSTRFTGFALLTAMPASETLAFLASGKIPANDFDALVCSSGSEVYYPGTYTEEDGRLYPDPDYTSHIDYRWGCEGLKKTIWKLLNPADGERKSGSSSHIEEEDLKSSNSHCISYSIKDPSKARKVDDLRQKLRMRGLRCHPMYCRRSTRMQIVPLLASRAQALRYLFVRWRLNVANMYVFLGESRDTDYEQIIAGTHKTIIMKGMVRKGSEELLRTSRSYMRDDIVLPESPLVATLNRDAPACTMRLRML